MKMKKEKTLIIITILILIIAVFGATYAYFSATGNLGKKSDVTVTTSSRDSTSTTSTNVSLRVDASDMQKLASSNDYDAYKDATTPGNIKITTTLGSGGGVSTCTYDITYTPSQNGVYLPSNANKTSLREYVLIINHTSTNASPVGSYDIEHDLTGVSSKITLTSNQQIIVTANQGSTTWSITPRYYNLEIDQTDRSGISFGGVVAFDNVVCTNKTPKLNEMILANNGGKTYIDNKTSPTFTSTEEDNMGMYAMADDYGTSYYFRGAVDNNWVYFGGFYWRIVRINGDGSVKLIYTGTTAPTEEEKVVKEEINVGMQVNINALPCANNSCNLSLTEEDIKNMFENDIYPDISEEELNCFFENLTICVYQPVISCLEDTCNVDDELIKQYVWEGNEDLLTEIEIACLNNNAGFCESKIYGNMPFKTQIGLLPFNTYNRGEYIGYMYEEGEHRGHKDDSTIKAYLDTWYEDNLLDYEAYLSDFVVCNDRGFQNNWEPVGLPSSTQYSNAYGRNWPSSGASTPTLICPNQEDAYTKSDNIKGNAKLKYPIGLLTADEVTLAGAYKNTSNDAYYLYTNEYYWLVSPFYVNTSIAYGFGVNSSGYFNRNVVNDTGGVRPVVSLLSGISASGSGLWNDPYVVD